MRVLLCLCLLWSGLLGAVEPAPPGAPEVVEPQAVVLWNRTIVELRQGIHGLSVEERAARIQRRIAQLGEEIIRQPVVSRPSTIDGIPGHAIFVGPEQVMTLTHADVPAALDPQVAAQEVVHRLREALDARLEQHRPEVLAWGIAWSLAASLLLGLVLWLELRAHRSLRRRIEALQPTLPHLAGIDPAPAVRRLLLIVLVIAAWSLSGGILYAWLTTVLSQFPYSQPLAVLLGHQVLGFGGLLLRAVASALPGLGMIVVIVFLTRLVAKALDSFFTSVEQGLLHIAWLDPDTAKATRRVAAIVLWLFSITVAYPYIPGSSSDAFKGVSVFAGLLLSFGSAGVVNQMMSGLVVVYARMMKPGDMVQVGEVAGQVTELGFLSTKVRTPVGHEVTLPNAILTGTAVSNFSRYDRSRGPMVSTTITIGYDTPWRQVHTLLTQAAAQTPGVVVESTPEILQTALTDFSVAYQLRCHITDVEQRFVILSDLHRRILDAFHDAGVQIMSPHFVTQPEKPVLPTSG